MFTQKDWNELSDHLSDTVNWAPRTLELVQAALAEKDAEIARLRLEAQSHAQESRTANATIAEIYQVVSGATGEPGNWHGAEPVRTRLDHLQAELDRVIDEAVINAEATVQFLVNYEWGGILAWIVEGAPTRQEGIAQSKSLVTQRTRITMMHELFLADSLVQSYRARQGKEPKP